MRSRIPVEFETAWKSAVFATRVHDAHTMPIELYANSLVFRQ